MLSAFCMFFKYPSPDAKASPSPSRGEGSGLLRRYTPRNDAVSNGEGLLRPWYDKILGTGCASRPRMNGDRGANSFGRSMIEMLGVLAIIAVLSVGGIAGYSKAMEKYKINKAINDYSYMIQGMLEHMDDFKKLALQKEKTMLADFFIAAQIVPESWGQMTESLNGNYLSSLQDNYGNIIIPYADIGTKGITIDFRFGGILNSGESYISQSFSREFCVNWFTNFAQPLSGTVDNVWFHRKSGTVILQGNNHCTSSAKCLNNLNLTEINNLCRSCDTKNE